MQRLENRKKAEHLEYAFCCKDYRYNYSMPNNIWQHKDQSCVLSPPRPRLACTHTFLSQDRNVFVENFCFAFLCKSFDVKTLKKFWMSCSSRFHCIFVIHTCMTCEQSGTRLPELLGLNPKLWDDFLNLYIFQIHGAKMFLGKWMPRQCNVWWPVKKQIWTRQTSSW